MPTDPTLLNTLEEAQGRNPLEFPYGFFLEDEYAGSAGGCFFWYTTEAELHNAIQNDLLEVLSDDNAQDKTLAKQAIALVLEAAAKKELDEPELLATLNELLKDIVPKYILMKLRLIILEAFTAEHSARTVAMKSATDNARDLLQGLVLLRNKVRQANITQEIMEIISSSEALKG